MLRYEVELKLGSCLRLLQRWQMPKGHRLPQTTFVQCYICWQMPKGHRLPVVLPMCMCMNTILC